MGSNPIPKISFPHPKRLNNILPMEIRRLTTIEKSAVVVGVVFIIFGFCTIIKPQEGMVFHPGPYRYRGILGPNQPEYVTKTGSKIYGGFSVVLGIAVVWAGLYRQQKG
jgi:hypothetical protein